MIWEFLQSIKKPEKVSNGLSVAHYLGDFGEFMLEKASPQCAFLHTRICREKSSQQLDEAPRTPCVLPFLTKSINYLQTLGPPEAKLGRLH